METTIKAQLNKMLAKDLARWTASSVEHDTIL
ncbi:hypothetical protein CCACVL1_12691 [Corchorus capsularis]|uniref:Uncharacterized protein n=1 Tax=Corchorus capsularis TaxID=210143 RepID=A0A1R3IEC7_COCAP|nr:hypothetical protein CCACVL1_12691 [Corchorus capsularis]